MDKSIQEELKKLCHETSIPETKINSLKDLKVTLIDSTKNPYHTMFDMALFTWSGVADKWKTASPELRFEVVKGVLEKKALPLALEAPYFAFIIENCSRSCFDQIARARIGVVYAARGFKDDDLSGVGFNMPSRIVSTELEDKVKKHAENSKALYKEIQEAGIPNWAARSVMPMYSTYQFMMVMNYSALQTLCSKRMQTTEMEDTVAVAWLMMNEVKLQFPLLAEYLRPAYDWSKKDNTAQVNGFSDVLGVPHASDNRHPGFEQYKGDVKWTEPCTNMKVLEADVICHFKKPNEWQDYSFETLWDKDKYLFTE